jgi:uncharacterized protein (TIGR02117 family)
MRMLRWSGLGFLAVLVLLAGFTTRWGDPALYPPAAGAPSTLVHVVSHGWHSGLAVPREALRTSADRQGLSRLTPVLDRFRDYPFIEIGWGEERFYRETPSVADVNVASALRALFRPGNKAVLHVVGLERTAPAVFRRSDILAVRLSERGFDRLVAFLDAAVAPDEAGRPREMGQGLYGPSLFYAATGTFSILQVCNQWVTRALGEAGLPYAPLLAHHPAGSFIDLEWRAGALRLSAP